MCVVSFDCSSCRNRFQHETVWVKAAIVDICPVTGEDEEEVIARAEGPAEAVEQGEAFADIIILDNGVVGYPGIELPSPFKCVDVRGEIAARQIDDVMSPAKLTTYARHRAD